MAYNVLHKLEGNIQAIRIALSWDGRTPVSEDDEALLKNYSGFGGIKAILYGDGNMESWKGQGASQEDERLYEPMQKLYALLGEHFDQNGYKAVVQSLKNSVLTAFYTPSIVPEILYSVLKNQGIYPQDIYEPSAGAGIFVTEAIKKFPSAKVTAVEKDLLTGKILKALTSRHPDSVAVHIKGFEQAPATDDGTYDLVVSNIPFGNFTVHDPTVDRRLSSRIHNYFFAKGLDKLKDGGLLAYVTTNGFLDSPSNQEARAYLFQRVNFICLAVMPDNLMWDTGGTNASSHLLIVQKDTTKKELSYQEGFLLETDERSNQTGTYAINRYINLHPWILIGNSIHEGTNQYGKPHLQVIQEGGLEGIAEKLSVRLIDGLSQGFQEAIFQPTIENTSYAPPLGKQLTILPMPPKTSGQQVTVQLGIFDTVPEGNQGRGADYLTEADEQHVARQTVRVVAMLKTREHADHECIVLLTARSLKSNFYLYKLFSNVADISFGRDWVKPPLLSQRLIDLAEKLKSFEHRYLFEGDENLKATLLPKTQQEPERLELSKPFYRQGTLVTHNGLVVRLGSVDKKQQSAPFQRLSSQKNRAFYERYIAVRDTFIELSERELSSGEPQKGLREDLNTYYDSFLRIYGPLNQAANRKLILEDAHGLVMLSSIERQEEGQQFVKSDILLGPLFKKEEVLKTDDPIQALARSLNEIGKVDLAFISAALGVNQEEAIDCLGDHIYLNPETDNWETSDQYLSGNVVEKLKAAELKAGLDPENSSYQKSLEALRQVQPEPIPFELLDFNLGERWIPVRYYERFADELFEQADSKINYFESLDAFRVSPVHNTKTDREYAVRPRGGRTMYGYTLLEHALENTAPFFTYETKGVDGSTVRVPDNEATQLAHQKIERIRSGFTEWLKRLPEDEKEFIEALYNETFNCYVLREYDGSHLDFSGLDRKALDIRDLYDSQKSAAWRIIQNRGALIDHEVGLGKTLTMIVSAQEMKRLGTVRKPMILAMKANVGQIAETYRKAYPKARILFPSENDFSPAKRLRLFHQIKNNNYDCVIMTHDQFGKIPQSPQVQQQIFQTELEHVEKDLETISRLGGEISKQMLKGLEIRKNNLGRKLRTIKRSIEEKKDAGIDFLEMGIDHLFIDESHKFKNLTFTTRHTRVAGLGNTQGSQKALNMLFAVRTLQEKFDSDLCVTFLSGTPISNSLTELYLIFKYLRPRELQRQRIENFDGWASVFARKTTDFEFSVTNQIVAKERFRHFIKLPELALFYNQITDYKTARHINLDKPELEETLVNIKPTPQQREFTKKLMEFAGTGNGELIGREALSREEDKGRMLIATNYAKKMSLDMRLINEVEYSDHPDSKINVCARKFAEIYHASTLHRGTQLIFCDQGTPGTAGFNVYDALKEKLTRDFGIPDHEIQFIHDWQGKKKPELFRLMNSGQIRGLVGSTEMLGTGNNVQECVVAMHHLDIPWKPSEMEQRNGRGARQGNRVARQHYDNSVQNYIYAVEQTLDSYKFNLLKNKQTFIWQMKNGTMGARTIDEGAMDESGMNFSEYIAILSGDTSLLEKSKLEKKIAVLEGLLTAYHREMVRHKNSLAGMEKERLTTMETLARLGQDEASYKGGLVLEKDGSKANPIHLEGITSADPDKAGQHLIKLAREWKARDGPDIMQIGELYGFGLFIRRNAVATQEKGRIVYDYYNSFYAQRPGGIKYTYNNGLVNMDNPRLAARYFLNAIDRIQPLIGKSEHTLSNLDKKIPELKALTAKPFDREEELQQMKTELSSLEREISINIQKNLLKNMAGREGEEIQAQLPEPASIKELNGHSASKTVPLLKTQRAARPRRVRI